MGRSTRIPRPCYPGTAHHARNQNVGSERDASLREGLGMVSPESTGVYRLLVRVPHSRLASVGSGPVVEFFGEEVRAVLGGVPIASSSGCSAR